MNREWVKNQEKLASEFKDKNGYAYIHTEVVDGRPATMTCGDMICILYGIEAEIARVSELTHTTFDDTMYVIAMNRKIGYENVKKLVGEERGVIKGSLDEMRDEIAKEMKRSNDKMEKNNDNLRTQVRNAKEDLKRFKVQAEKASKEAFRENQKLQKEILRLNHENERLVKLLQEKSRG